MNNSMNKLALAIGIFMIAGGAMAATGSATVGGTVIVPIAISSANGPALSFGNLAAGNGVVTVSTKGGRTASGTITTPLVGFGSSPTAARFDITGLASQTFSISTTGTSTTLTSTATDAVAMPFALITETLTGVAATSAGIATTGANATTGTLSSGTPGGATIYAGGALTVASNQTPGIYTGTVSLTVEYN